MSSEYSREPVPTDAANRPARSITMMISNAVMGVPVMILGASIGTDYGAVGAWLVIAVGCAITAALAALISFAGVKSRRSTALLAKQAFGPSGAHLLNLAIAVALLGWFSVEMGFVGALLADGFANVFGLHIGRGPGIIGASVLICVICIFGIAWVARAPLLFLPLLGVLLVTVLWLALHQTHGLAPAMSTPKSVGTGISAVVGSYIVGCLIMPDYSRFVRTPGSAVTATILALGPIYALVLGTYALAALATHAALPSLILTGLRLPAVIGLLLPVGLMQNGIMCLYSSALATSTLTRVVSFRSITVGSMLIGLVLALAGADMMFVSFLVVLGIVFPPAAALLIYAGLFEGPDLSADGASIRWGEVAVWCFGIGCGAASEWWGLSLTGFSAFDGFMGAVLATIIMHMRRQASSRRLIAG